MLRSIKIAVDKPIAAGASDVVHTGTSYQVSKIPDFTKPEFMIVNVNNDTINLLHKRFEYDMLDTQALYVRTKYHYDNNRESNWSKIMPLRGDQIGIKLSNTVINTPVVNAELTYNDNGTILITSSPYKLFAGVGAHRSTSYQVLDTDGVVYYNRDSDVDNLTSIEIPLSKLETGKSYIVKVKYTSDTNTDSNYGKYLLTLDTKDNSLFHLDMPYYFVPKRNVWFKVTVYTPRYKSIDIRILDKFDTVVASTLDQITITPNIYTGDLVIGDVYRIQARIGYNDGSKTEYVTTNTVRAEQNVLMHINPTTTYLGKYTFTQYMNTNGEAVQSSYESYSHGILLGKSDSNDVFRYRKLDGKLYELEKAFSLNNIGTLRKAFLNFMPIHNSMMLVDYSAGTDNGNVKSPEFKVFEYNVITQKFKELHSLIRLDEKYSTAISASAVPVVGDDVYYIPAESTDGSNGNYLKLKVYNAYTNIGGHVSDLPVPIKKYGNLVKIDDNTLLFFGGVIDPIAGGDTTSYLRTNNDVYTYNIRLNVWAKVNQLPTYIPDTVFNMQAYVRKDGKVVLFNNVEVGASVGDQNTYVYDIVSNTFELENSDMLDNLRYSTTISFQNGDFGRISNQTVDPQKLFTYVSNTKTEADIVDNGLVDTVIDLVINPGEEITIESPYRYRTINILGTSTADTGILHWITADSVLDFDYRDLIVTRDTALTNNLYDPLQEWGSITILDGVEFSVRNVLIIPDNTTFTIDAPFEAEEIKIGANSELIVNTN